MARLFVPRWTGIATRMTVPFEGALSMTHVPPIDVGNHQAAKQFLSSLALVVWTLLVPIFYKGND